MQKLFDSTLPDKPENIVCATLLTGRYDVNRNEQLSEDNFDLVRGWYNSVVRLKMRGIIFHNTFSGKTSKRYENEHITFIAVDFDKKLNANVFRYLLYQEFIQTYSSFIKAIFVTDIADVEVVINPFDQSFFLNNPTALFCGDEPKPLANEWMNDHSTHLRNAIPEFSSYEQANGSKTLLNCGVIGGTVQVMQPLIDSLAAMHRQYTTQNTTPYTLDMGTFNYIARTRFGDQLLHGAPINTVFKGYETTRSDCWFRHK